MKYWECSVCHEIYPNDKDIKTRKIRHEGRHTRVDKRAVGGGNNIKGVVEWKLL